MQQSAMETLVKLIFPGAVMSVRTNSIYSVLTYSQLAAFCLFVMQHIVSVSPNQLENIMQHIVSFSPNQLENKQAIVRLQNDTS